MAYRFDQFTLDVELQELRAGDDLVSVQKKVFELLIFLIQHRDRVLDKDEIQEAVWPDTIVSETALTRAILKARRAVGDDAQQQKLIKTVHGTGYRFVAEVNEFTPDPVQPSAERAAEQLSRTDDRRIGGRRADDRRSDVFRVATAYGAIAWLTNQIAAMIFEAFELDKLGLQILLGISLLGFPIALGVTWFFRWTPEGLKRRDELLDGYPITGQSTRYLATAIIVAIALGLTLVWQLRDIATPEQVAEQSIESAHVAVLPLNNVSGQAQDNWTRLGIMSLLSEELKQARIDVLKSSVVMRMVGEDVSDLQIDEALMDRFANAQQVQFLVMPSLERTDSGYTLTLQLFDGEQLWTMERSGDVLPTELAMSLREQLIGHLRPARYVEQYQSAISRDPFVNELYARGMHEELSGNLTEARDLFALAVKQDPEFFLARYEYAITVRYLGEFEEAEPLLTELLDDALELNEPHYIAIVCNGLGVLYHLKGDVDAAIETYQLGISAAQQGELGVQHAILLINYAISERSKGDLSSARQMLGQALSIYREMNIPPDGSVYVSLANIAVNESNLREAEENYLLALDTYQMQEHPAGVGIVYANLAWLAQEEARYPESLEFLEASLEVRRSIDDRVGILRALIRQSSIQHDMGLLTASMESAQAVLDDTHSDQENSLRGTAIALMGMSYSEIGRIDEAIRYLNDTVEIRRQRQDLSGRLTAQNVLAGIYIKGGRYGHAEQLLNEILTEAVAAQQPGAEIEARFHLANLKREAVGAEASLEFYQEALDRVRLLANEALEQKVTVAFATALVASGDMDSAEGLLGLVADMAVNRDLELARADLYEAKNQFDEAAQALQNAKAVSYERWTNTDENRLKALTARET